MLNKAAERWLWITPIIQISYDTVLVRLSIRVRSRLTPASVQPSDNVSIAVRPLNYLISAELPTTNSSPGILATGNTVMKNFSVSFIGTLTLHGIIIPSKTSYSGTTSHLHTDTEFSRPRKLRGTPNHPSLNMSRKQHFPPRLPCPYSKSAATTLSTYRVTDNGKPDGKVIGYEANQDDFIAEIERMKASYKNLLKINGGGLSNDNLTDDLAYQAYLEILKSSNK
mgnify:CR=1 FL=1